MVFIIIAQVVIPRAMRFDQKGVWYFLQPCICILCNSFKIIDMTADIVISIFIIIELRPHIPIISRWRETKWTEVSSESLSTSCQSILCTGNFSNGIGSIPKFRPHSCVNFLIGMCLYKSITNATTQDFKAHSFSYKVKKSDRYWFHNSDPCR